MASKSLKVLVQEVQATEKAWKKLTEEHSMCCDSQRYAELTGPHGLVRKANKAWYAAREALAKRLTSVTAVPAYMLKDLF